MVWSKTEKNTSHIEGKIKNITKIMTWILLKLSKQKGRFLCTKVSDKHATDHSTTQMLTATNRMSQYEIYVFLCYEKIVNDCSCLWI